MNTQPMKLGTDTGSVTNWMMSAGESKPVVGKGMTRFFWSDREAYEVVFVSGDGKRVIVQRYDATHKAFSEEPGQLGELLPYKEELRYRYGSWWRMGQGGPNSKWKVRFGIKESYRDPHF